MGNGVICANCRLVPANGLHMSALDRGFTLGDGVFETLRVVGGKPFRLGDHFARLHRPQLPLALPFLSARRSWAPWCLPFSMQTTSGTRWC